MNATYRINREEQRLTVEGITYSPQELDRLLEKARRCSSEFLEELYHFLRDWFSESETLIVHTSGSTGKPKELTVQKSRMTQSARLTCEFLRLREGDKALLCMPLKYIAGKMVVVRALVGGLDLTLRVPSGHPFADWDGPAPHFAAMIPLQVYNSLRIPEERKILAQTRILIIGGGAIDPSLEEEIRSLPNTVYSTYGMTETLSHIALRRLNGPEASPYYHPFNSVKLSLSPEGTLIIDAPLVCEERLVTNDIARILPDGSFVIIGRKDNIINSGGIKIQIEEMEKALLPYLSSPFAVTSVPDPRLGEAVVLLVQGEPRQELPAKSTEHLPKYGRPKKIIEVDKIPQTGSGKIDRAECKRLARQILLKHE